MNAVETLEFRCVCGDRGGDCAFCIGLSAGYICPDCKKVELDEHEERCAECTQGRAEFYGSNYGT